MKYAIETENISKYFGENKANDQINIQIKEGTVHSICGENGAGKSTLMNVLYGLYLPTFGKIKVFGEEVSFHTSLDAIKKGIGMVHQHFMLIQNLTVAENIILGKETGSKFHLDRKKAVKDVEFLMETYKLMVDPHARIDEISVGMQQRVEILKALYRGANILILDEPTAVLAPQEINELFESIRFLISQGKTVILISHKLKEVMEISDEISVLRLGKMIGTIDRKDATKELITQMMVGRDVKLGGLPREKVKKQNNVLEIKGLNYTHEKVDKINHLDLTVSSGEIVGIAGIDGNGQSELAELINGTVKPISGTMSINGKDPHKLSVRDIRKTGLGFIPEDRHRDGLVLDFTISYNMVLGYHHEKPFAKRGFLDFKKMDEFTMANKDNYDIRMQQVNHHASTLSGGNQQKVILARELSRNPNIIIACQPTRGLDIGAMEYVHNALVSARNQGQGVLLISFELDELIALSDRICVMYNGSIVGEQTKGNYDIKTIGEMMLGLRGKGHAE